MSPPGIAIAVALLLAVSIGYGRWEARDLRVRRVSLDLPSLPNAFDGYRIVFASDFHARRLRAYERRVLATLGELRGDLLVLGGDYQATRATSAYGAKTFLDAVAALAPRFPDGIVATSGNHDSDNLRHFLRRHRTIRYLGKTPLIVRRRGERIAVAGVRKGPRKTRAVMARRMRAAAASIPDDVAFRILVAHWPDYYPAARDAGFALVLSGDTHGGQIRLPIIGPIDRKTGLPRRFAYGLVHDGDGVVYTTSGIGTRFLPLRLLCPPEIVVFELRRARESDRIA